MLWTRSIRPRAEAILKYVEIDGFKFDQIICEGEYPSGVQITKLYQKLNIYLKDIFLINPDSRKILLIDDQKQFLKTNSIQILAFEGNQKDKELSLIYETIIAAATYDDLKAAVLM
jgi:hypothetical protein